MCQSTTNCCVTCSVPSRGKGLWVTIAALLAASFALVCAWAYIAIRVDALILLRAARLSLTDTPTVVASWWSPTARHLLARETAAGRVALPAGPGAIQATMAVLALAPAGLVAWVRCGCPAPAPVSAWLPTRAQVRMRVVVTRAPAPVRAVMHRPTSPALPASASARETATATTRTALPPRTSTARTARPRVAALPAPPPAPSSTVVPPLRFIRPAQPAPRSTPPAADPATSIAAKRR